MPTCQGKATETSQTETFAAFVGIDWADKEHAICVLDGDQNTSDQLKHSAEAIESANPSTHSTRAAGSGVSATVARRVAANPPSLPHSSAATL